MEGLVDGDWEEGEEREGGGGVVGAGNLDRDSRGEEMVDKDERSMGGRREEGDKGCERGKGLMAVRDKGAASSGLKHEGMREQIIGPNELRDDDVTCNQASEMSNRMLSEHLEKVRLNEEYEEEAIERGKQTADCVEDISLACEVSRGYDFRGSAVVGWGHAVQ